MHISVFYYPVVSLVLPAIFPQSLPSWHIVVSSKWHPLLICHQIQMHLIGKHANSFLVYTVYTKLQLCYMQFFWVCCRPGFLSQSINGNKFQHLPYAISCSFMLSHCHSLLLCNAKHTNYELCNRKNVLKMWGRLLLPIVIAGLLFW